MKIKTSPKVIRLWRNTIKLALLSLAILITVLGWKLYPYSQAESSKFAEECLSNACCMAYREEMDAVKNKWNENLAAMMDQEKPASAMVDEAFENLRTYQCWMEYICRSVQYSGYGTPESTEGTGIVNAHIGTIPGCQAPEAMGLTSALSETKSYIKDNWELLKNTLEGGGASTVNVDMPSDWFVSNGLPFLPACMADMAGGNKNINSKSLSSANASYQQCMDFMNSQFGCKNTEDGLKDCTNQSIATIKLETELKKNSADQMARALETKFNTIMPKMANMEQHVEYLKTKLQNLDSRFECYLPTCN